MSYYVFSPAGTTKNITASSVTSNVNLPVYSSSTVLGGRTVRVFNPTGVTVFIEFGASSAIQAALATSLPVPAGAVEYFEVGPQITYVAGITASGGGTVYFTEGQGN